MRTLSFNLVFSLLAICIKVFAFRTNMNDASSAGAHVLENLFGHWYRC